ncbi:uncharacterized protein LOC135845450 [Planococcus citri]|uniref:uncharacterized protein LOC135845450 n=1 Tax=Planococcus citri TaxID=170843 RepID=UPI0031F78850
MLRLNQDSQLVKDESGSIDQNRNMMDNDDTSSDLSDSEHFLTKGAFLLTPANEMQMERVGMICEKMNYKGPFSLTKTATGILFKFADLDDYQLTFKKGFHKVTGSRFYKKIPVPCRPQKTFTIFVFEIPEEIPEDDIRHSLYKFRSIVEVYRLPSPSTQTVASASSGASKSANDKNAGAVSSTEMGCVTNASSAAAAATGCFGFGLPLSTSSSSSSSPSVIRITLASLDECNILLRDGLDFYGATYFPTEPAMSTSIVRAGAKKTAMHNSRLLDLIASSGLRIRDVLPVFDAAGFSRIPAPVTKSVGGRL